MTHVAPTLAPTVEVQIATADGEVPSEDDFTRWVSATLPDPSVPCELTIRVVDQAESRDLNHRYRHVDKATNVLAFPSELPQELNLPLLGDLVICAAIVEQEALAQHKSLEAHWAHMVVHGTLHLLGYDHQTDADAERMEAAETRILTGLDYAAPYEPGQ